MLTVFGCLASLTLTSACLDNKCNQIAEEPVRYTDGHTSADRTFYQSSTPDELLLRFPAARKFQMVHGLREKPVDVSVFVSFFADGVPQSLAAGDEARLVIAEDYVEVHNNTCADFFVRLTAWTTPNQASTAEQPTPEQPSFDAAGAEQPTTEPAVDVSDAAGLARDR